MPTPNAIQASQAFRRRLLEQEAQAVERMAIIYARIYNSLLFEIDLLAEQIAGMDKPDRETIIKMARTRQILKQVKEQVVRFGGTVADEVTIIQAQAIQQGIDDALSLMQLSLPNLPNELSRQIVGSFTRLPADAIIAAAGLMGSDSPLNEALSTAYGEYVAEMVEGHLLDGMAAGLNPREITRRLQRNLQGALGSGLTSALTTIRTAQIKSYQLANHATYQANPKITPKWVWHSALDSRACLSCISKHGKEYPITETLRDHHNGRCAPVPKTISYKDLGIDLPDPVERTEAGEDWFKRQPESVQREMMGPARYDAFKAGKFKFDELSRPYDDPVYGELLREASLKDLLGSKAKEYYQ